MAGAHRVLEEPDRAVAEGEIGAAGVPAAIGADEDQGVGIAEGGPLGLGALSARSSSAGTSLRRRRYRLVDSASPCCAGWRVCPMPSLRRARRSVSRRYRCVCDVPSVMSSNRIALFRKRTPLLLALIGASTSLWSRRSWSWRRRWAHDSRRDRTGKGSRGPGWCGSSCCVVHKDRPCN